MAYVIALTDGTIYTVLGDGVVDNSLSVSLIGQNFQNYGQLIANNFVHLLENSSNSTPPINPLAGQIWWNNATKVLSFYDGNKFKPASSSELGPTPPFDPLDGDQWWNTDTNQLNVWNGTAWMVVGPAYSKGQGFSGMTTITTVDNVSHSHVISTLQSDAVIVALVNSDPQFTLSTPFANISTVGSGITLTPSSSVTGTIYSTGGTINNSTVGATTPAAGTFTTLNSTTQAATNSTVTSILVVGTGGNIITVGTQQISSISPLAIIAGNTSIALDSTNGTITANVNPTIANSITTKSYVDSADTSIIAVSEGYTDSSITSLIAGSPLTTLNALSAAINNDASYYVNANAAIGLKADKFNTVLTGTTTISADLAEVYVSDAIYVAGDVLIFDGANDVTTTSSYCDQRIAGVVSPISPASTNALVAQAGKVLCNVIGPVVKGDLIVSSVTPGYGIKLALNSDWKPGCVIGKSLVTDGSIGTRQILIAVGRF